MKKQKTVLFLVLILALACWGCGNATEKNTAAWGSIYNPEKDISISLGDTEESLKEKLSAEQYRLGESYVDSEGRACIRYELRDGDNMVMLVDFADAKVTGIAMFPSLWYDMEVSSIQESIDAALGAKCPWLFKDSVTAQSTREEVYAAWGKPSSEGDMRGDTPTGDLSDHADMADYYFTDKGEVVAYDDNAAGRVSLMFLNGRLIQLELGATE